MAPSAPADAAKVDLAGKLTTDQGVNVGVRSELWLSTVTSTVPVDHPQGQGWVNVRVELAGRVALSNLGTKPRSVDR